MKITNKLCLSVASALLFFGLCTYPAVSLNASQTTVKSQSTTSSTEAVSLKALILLLHQDIKVHKSHGKPSLELININSFVPMDVLLSLKKPELIHLIS